MLSEIDIREALRSVKYPGFSRDIVSFGLLKNVEISKNRIQVQLAVTTNDPDVPEQIRQAVQRVIEQLPGVDEVQVRIDVHSASTSAGGATVIEGVRHTIAVASGKGGVGKSTVAANIAIALRHLGASVGICDCDIYGPSIALMFGGSERPCADEQNRILPIERYGIKLMSMGFLLEDGSPAVLRGPLVTRYTQQFLRQVDWKDLDYLILDLPPGTGDIQLTIVQTVALSGAIVVTTPQEASLLDVRKAVSMFEKTHVRVLGIVENMSYFLCPGDGKRYDLFGRGGGEREANRLGIPLLAEIPIQPDICTAGDKGRPLVDVAPDSAVAQSFLTIAKNLRKTDLH
ncbi:MAG: chromosome partitioning protein [Verrucomicrobia bacterium]|nr:MAG: chromosome partitioning protein [Verrucomicrobiota bacterium]